MGIDDTAGSTVPVAATEPEPPPDPGPSADARGGPSTRWFVGWVVGSIVALAMLFVLFADAAWVGIDDYVLAPGSASDTASAIAVDGADSYPPEGSIDFTTVSIRRDVTLWDWFRARNSETSELVPPEDIDGDRTSDETRRVTQFQMEQSQDTAVIVALEYLGYEVVPEVEGAFVVALVPDSPAEVALQLGDLVVAVDDAPVRSSQDLADIIAGLDAGDSVAVTLRRTPEGDGGDGSAPDAVEQVVDIELAPHPDIEGSGFLGVRIETPVRVDAPFDVSIDVGRVRGPSAGLAFSLAVLDVVTPGELTGGIEVATTGTIDRFGFVGPVGGVRQKAAAAEAAGAVVFLVPPSEYADALAAAGDDLEVRCVQTFDDAVLTLAEDYGGNGLDVAAEAGVPAPERSPSPIDADDGFVSCAEAVGGAL